MYKAYWGTEADNFGDILNKNILEYCGVQHEHTTDYEDANLFMVGSVVRLAKNSVVLGSGIIKSGTPEELDPNNTYEFVRGPRTRERVLACGGTCPEIYGDAALLLPRFCPPGEKKYRIGFVPHYEHINDYSKTLAEERQWHFIDVRRKDPLFVAKEISACEKIVSTSLHGIIAAHAYGIPAAHYNIDITKKLKNLYGESTKFVDYYESVGLKHKYRSIDDLEYTVGTLPDLNLIESLIRKYA
jgi:pyruvyltransferase